MINFVFVLRDISHRLRRKGKFKDLFTKKISPEDPFQYWAHNFHDKTYFGHPRLSPKPRNLFITMTLKTLQGSTSVCISLMGFYLHKTKIASSKYKLFGKSILKLKSNFLWKLIQWLERTNVSSSMGESLPVGRKCFIYKLFRWTIFKIYFSFCARKKKMKNLHNCGNGSILLN